MTREERFDQMRRNKPVQELERKARKATRHKQKIWTVEEIDLGHSRAKSLLKYLSVE